MSHLSNSDNNINVHPERSCLLTYEYAFICSIINYVYVPLCVRVGVCAELVAHMTHTCARGVHAGVCVRVRKGARAWACSFSCVYVWVYVCM